MFTAIVGKTPEYALYAFKTSSGIYTLIGSDKSGLDSFKNLSTGTYHEWMRADVYKWWKNDKIEPIQEAVSVDWYRKKL